VRRSLDAMTRVVNDRDIGIAGSFLEFANRALEIHIADALLQRQVSNPAAMNNWATASAFFT
jgi:hypothetical protein